MDPIFGAVDVGANSVHLLTVGTSSTCSPMSSPGSEIP
jgi:hypothetical protein